MHATSPETLTYIIANTLPSSSPSSPQLPTPQDALASTTHATLTALGFRLRSTGPAPTQNVSPSDPEFLQPLPQEWNHHPGQYSFTYTHDQAPSNSTLYTVTIESDPTNSGILSISAQGGGEAAKTHLKPWSAYFAEGGFPASPGTSGLAVRELFLSDEKIGEVGEVVYRQIAKVVLPGLRLVQGEEVVEGKGPAPGREEESLGLGRGKAEELMGRGEEGARGRVGL